MALDLILDDYPIKSRPISSKEAADIGFLFYRDYFSFDENEEPDHFKVKYKSYFSFAYNDKTVNASGRFVGYAGSLFNQSEDDVGYLMCDMFKGVDVYVTANSFCTRNKREMKYLINLQNMVIDIDGHNSSLSANSLNEHIEKLEKKLVNRIKVKPNYINHTGRGLQLWYCFTPCSVLYADCVKSCISALCDEIEGIMSELGETELSIDRPSSLKINGLYRLPFSYNTNAACFGYGYLLHNEVLHIKELHAKISKKKYSNGKIAKEKYRDAQIRAFSKDCTKKKPKKTENMDYTPLLSHRKAFIEHLFATRDITVGSRNYMLFAAYATFYALYGEADAQELAHNLNDNLAVPLLTSELHTIFKSVAKKPYKYSVSGFFKLVEATPDERKWYQKGSKSSRLLKAQQKRNDKIERDRKIHEMALNDVNITDIARELGVTRQTVYNVINRGFPL